MKTKTPWLAIWFVLFAAGLAVWLALLFTGSDPGRAWRALLVDFLFFTPLSAGMVTWSAIVVCSNGRWAGTSERLSWYGLGFLIPSFLILIALWIGSPQWAPWYGKADLRQGVWLDNTFVFLRDIGGLFIFWTCSFWYLGRRRKGRRIAWVSGGTFIAVFCVIFSLIGFDLVMALNTEWQSTAFGAYFFISSLYSAIVMWGLLVAFQPDYGPGLRQDFGKLILAFSVLTTYFFFIQLLPIWYENLPDETLYTIHRKNYLGWNVISGLIIGIVYLGPLIMLLTKKAKRGRYTLGGIALLLLTGLWFERWWMVTPTFTLDPVFGIVEVAAAASILGLFGLAIQAIRRYLPTVPEEEGSRS